MEKQKDEMETKKDKNSEQERVEENKETLISTHIFILPFKILKQCQNNREETILRDNCCSWKDYIINPDTEKYLNKYAKEALFSNYGDSSNNNRVIEKYYKDIRNGVYKIFDKNSNKEYLLEIEDIKIKGFDTNVGTLSFILNNRKYKKMEDILSINNQGRKLYRAYETEKCPIITLYDSLGREIVSQDIKNSDIIIQENEKLQNKIISYFLKTENIEIVLDDRMFVMSHYLENDCVPKNSWKNYENWYKYIFVDRDDDLTCQDEETMEKLLKKATYSRWKNYGTLYGICRYAFVVWTDESPFSKNVINLHLKNHYFQLVSLLIAQRATIISLNEGMNALINRILNSEEIGKEIIEYDESDEFKEYLIYLSKMNFQEISQQEQAIELYDLFREQLKIKELTEELNLKIKSLNRKAERKSDKEEAKREKEIQTKIGRFGVLLTIISLLTGGIFEISFKEKGMVEIIVMFGLILLVVVFSRPLINYNEFPKYLKEVVNSWKCKKNSN